MHGKGKLELPSGEIIETEWVKGQKLGDGFTNKNGKRSAVIYYYDLEIN